MKKHAKRIFLIIAIILVTIFVLEHAILVSIAKTAIKYIVALETHMNRVILNPFKGSITVRGLKISNPQGFQEPILASIPRITMDFSAKTLFEKGSFFDKIIIHVKELNIIRNKDNVVNLSKLKALTPKENGNSENTLPFNAESYVIEIEKVNYIDYTKDQKEVREIDLNVKEEYKNLRSPENIALTIAFKVFYNGKIGNIGVDIQKIQKDLAKLAEDNKSLTEEFALLAQAKLEEVKEKVGEKVEEAKESIKEKVEDIKDKIEENGKN